MLALYDALHALTASPVAAVNRAVALAEVEARDAVLHLLDGPAERGADDGDGDGGRGEIGKHVHRHAARDQHAGAGELRAIEFKSRIGRAVGPDRDHHADRPDLAIGDDFLAPQVIERIFAILREVNARGVSILLVEQNAKLALEIAARGYVMESGAITLAAAAKDLKTTAAKLFASFYALFSGMIFLVAIGVLSTPILHRFLQLLQFLLRVVTPASTTTGMQRPTIPQSSRRAMGFPSRLARQLARQMKAEPRT